MNNLRHMFANFRRDRLNWFTKREMKFAYIHGASTPSDNMELLDKYAEFYITMDLFVDADPA